MTEIQVRNYSRRKQLGCSFVGAIFHRPSRKTAASPPTPPLKPLPLPETIKPDKMPTKAIQKPSKKVTYSLPKVQKPLKKVTYSLPEIKKPSKKVTYSLPEIKKLTKEKTFSESDLSMKLSVTQIASESGTLYRASSNNAMILSHLGNLKPNSVEKTLTIPTPSKENERIIVGNLYRGGGRSINGSGPEVLNNMGTEEYKKGKFEEAISLYNQAITLDSKKASYYSNKSAALIGLDRLIEAVFECRVAVRLEPFHFKAHNRLGKLYHRLGKADRALWHYKQCDTKIENEVAVKLQSVKIQRSKCIQARKVKDWDILLKATLNLLSSGADSAPKVYAMRAEALLNLHRHQEAYSTILKSPNFDIDLCTQFFGSYVTAYFLMIRAQVFLAAGRFEEAVTVANRAARIDHSSNEVNLVIKKARALAVARSNGNHLFKDAKFVEASVVYSEGLEQEPNNAILLSNRAACLSNLGHYEKAIEDCNAALKLRPGYTKARLRRADCNVKLRKWATAIQDYERLNQEISGDEEIVKGLCEARIQFRKQQGEYT